MNTPASLDSAQQTKMKFKKYLLLGLIVLIVFVSGWFFTSSSVSKKARIAAIAALQDNLGRKPKNGTLVVIDFMQPSQTNRLEVMNIETGKIVFYGRVAHGKNSGDVYASRLSNIIGSLQSSAGLFEITEKFNGKQGPSLRLKGLNPFLNGNAEKRGIIIHSAKYVSWTSILANWKEKCRLGRSEGCFALSSAGFQKLSLNLLRPAYLYAHHDKI